MATVHHWTGVEARALRLALRMSVRGFADHLGVAVRTISKWERLLASTAPRPDTQAILDTALARSDAAVHLRFETFLSEASRPTEGQHRRVTAAGPRAWEYESWSDDLERAVVALNQQNFAFADHLLGRWLPRFPSKELDDKGLYLLARSTALLGDLRRDQGAVIGPLSAHQAYTGARSIFTQLGIPRRVAQLDLSLAVVTEMSGSLETAARNYEQLAIDDRLGLRDRARAMLWVGTALSKDGNHDYAARVMLAATRNFEDLTEPEDWSVAHQKLALAHRGSGNLTHALQCITIAQNTGITESPMQCVRLNTAYGHILLSDPATVDDGVRKLDQAARLAAEYSLSHQLRSIESIRTTIPRASDSPGR
ncbi:helix-turn-helix domain-containing protein [Streptomyces sp. NPDC057638]|uniref:helix-turn-helix domain-containing protein n=1 Tax=Streptomyces sp. NPDC057638 TaxID=3346190 RepID=UPI0036B061A5